MAGKRDAHEVIHFTLHEIGALPDTGDGSDRRIVFRQAGLEAKACAMGQRQQVIDDFKSLAHRPDSRPNRYPS